MNLAALGSGKSEVLMPELSLEVARKCVAMIFYRNPQTFGSQLANKIAAFVAQNPQIKFSYLETTYLGGIIIGPDQKISFSYFSTLPCLRICFRDQEQDNRVWEVVIEGELNIGDFIEELEKIII